MVDGGKLGVNNQDLVAFFELKMGLRGRREELSDIRYQQES
jgi:hypothetical protein